MEEYLSAIEKIKNRFKIKGDLVISDILKLPNVLISEKSEISQKTEEELLQIIKNITDHLIESRTSEGENLKKDLDKRFSICSQKMDQIKILFNKLMKKQKESIKKTVILSKNGDEEAKLKLDELYSTLNKIDIHEEIIRFKSHLESIKKVMKDDFVEKGKRMDFILQELVRESNTVLAKCSSFDISSISVDVKVELEKAREQTQNLV